MDGGDVVCHSETGYNLWRDVLSFSTLISTLAMLSIRSSASLCLPLPERLLPIYQKPCMSLSLLPLNTIAAISRDIRLPLSRYDPILFSPRIHSYRVYSHPHWTKRDAFMLSLSVLTRPNLDHWHGSHSRTGGNAEQCWTRYWPKGHRCHIT